MKTSEARAAACAEAKARCSAAEQQTLAARQDVGPWGRGARGGGGTGEVAKGGDWTRGFGGFRRGGGGLGAISLRRIMGAGYLLDQGN